MSVAFAWSGRTVPRGRAPSRNVTVPARDTMPPPAPLTVAVEGKEWLDRGKASETVALVLERCGRIVTKMPELLGAKYGFPM